MKIGRIRRADSDEKFCHVALRMRENQVEAIDGWARRQGNITRAEAVRRLVYLGLVNPFQE